MSADSSSRRGPGSRPGRGEDEKEELIGQILELQNTLQDLSQRINSVKEENSKLKSENQVWSLGLRELCRNHFENSSKGKELRIIPE